MAPRAAEALGVGPAALPPLLLFGSADRCSTVAPQAVADAIEDDPSLRLEGSCPELFAEAIRGNADRRVRGVQQMVVGASLCRHWSDFDVE